MKINADKFKELLEEKRDQDYIDKVVDDCMESIYKGLFRFIMDRELNKLYSVMNIYGKIYFNVEDVDSPYFDDSVKMDKPLCKKHIAHILEGKLLEDGYDSVTVSVQERSSHPYAPDTGDFLCIKYNIEVDTRKEENEE